MVCFKSSPAAASPIRFRQRLTVDECSDILYSSGYEEIYSNAAQCLEKNLSSLGNLLCFSGGTLTEHPDSKPY